MFSSASLFNGVNLILVAACLISTLLAFKFVPDKRVRVALLVAFVLLIIASGLYPFCLKVYRLHSVAVAGEAFGKAPPGTVNRVMRVRSLAQLGNIFEVVATVIFVFVAKGLVSLGATGKTEGKA